MVVRVRCVVAACRRSKLRRPFEAVENARVARAAAEMSGKPRATASRSWVQPCCKSTRREPESGMQKRIAPAFHHERVAKHTVHLRLNALERCDFVPFHLLGLRSKPSPAGHPPRRCSSRKFLRRAAVLGRGDVALLAQHIEEVHPGYRMRQSVLPFS